MKKLVMMAILAVAMVSVSSAFTSNGRYAVSDEPVKNDTVKTECKKECKEECPKKAAADTVKAAPQAQAETAE